MTPSRRTTRRRDVSVRLFTEAISTRDVIRGTREANTQKNHNLYFFSNFCFLPFYLSTSSNWFQSSVVFLEVETCFYLVILVSFLTGG